MLIKCPECGKSVSDTAITCPNCGFAISNTDNIDVLKVKQILKTKRERSKFTSIGVVVILVIIAIGGITYYKSTSFERAQARLNESTKTYQETTDELNRLQDEYDKNKQIIDSYE